MKLPRIRFSIRVLLLLPVVVTAILYAVDPLTARPDFWRLASLEVDAVDARDQRAVPALVTLIYEGPLAGQPNSGSSYTTLGEPYREYRGMTPQIGYGGLVCIVHHLPGTRIFRRPDRTVTEGIRIRVEADGYEPFEFVPSDSRGRPAAFETWDPPVFRASLRPKGASTVVPSWSTRPKLKIYRWGAR